MKPHRRIARPQPSTLRTPAGATFTPHELRELVEATGYELKMAAALSAVATPEELVAVGFALVEATLLHVRNLDSFLGRDTARQEDGVIALHYAESWVPTPVLTENERTELNQRLFRISQQGVRLNAEWDRPTLGRRTLETFDLFITVLANEHPERAAWFRGDVADAKALLASPITLTLGA
jgi:hypothetical protein